MIYRHFVGLIILIFDMDTSSVVAKGGNAAPS